MNYKIIKEGENKDGNYEIVINQIFESVEKDCKWETPIMMIYSAKVVDYSLLPDSYKEEVNEQDYVLNEIARAKLHEQCISDLKSGDQEKRDAIIQDLLEQHRVALKSSGHINQENIAKHKTLTEEEISKEISGG